MRLRGIVHAIGVKARHVFKGKTLLRKHVHLAGNADTITQRAKIFRQASRAAAAGRMVPRTTVAQWKLSGVKLRTAGLADRHRQIGGGENQNLRGERMKVAETPRTA